MAEFVAFQQFKPSEQRNDNRCIWCKRNAQKNKAHIISRKLTLTSHASTTLRYSVCKSCNERCGEIEQWILRHSPLGWLRFFYYYSSNQGSNTKGTPSYFYAKDLHQWLICKIEGNRETRTIDTQLILLPDKKLQFITELPPEVHAETEEKIFSMLRTGGFQRDIRPSLPEDFAPRALWADNHLLLIARNSEDSNRFIAALPKDEDILRARVKERIQPQNSGQQRQHFKWSQVNWVRFCAKIAYETLCLLEGTDSCLRPEFEAVRAFVLQGASSHHREVIFDEGGPINEQNVPRIPNVDLSIGQNAPLELSAFVPSVEPGMHCINLYEVDGWVCASVSISGFPSCVMVLGGPDLHIKDLYLSIYDEEVNEFDFIRLAYDRRMPIIPLEIAGGMNETIRRTYKLTLI